MDSESADSPFPDLNDLRPVLASMHRADRSNSRRAPQRAPVDPRHGRKYRISKPLSQSGASSKNPKDPQPAQSWAHLPHDILHELCRTLRQSGQVETLSALRLTCKGFVPVVTEYLFRVVHLDRTMGSIRRLTALSKTRLAEHVREVHLDAEMVLEPLDHMQWPAAVKSFNRAIIPAEDYWWGRHAYEVALARQRDSDGLSTAARLKQWHNYQAILAEQRELNYVDNLELMRVLGQAFQRLPLVTRVECKAYHGSKYALSPTAPLEQSVSQVRRTFLQTMTLPRFIRPFSMTHRIRDDYLGAFYAFAVAHASMSYGRNLQHLSFTGTSEVAFYYLQSLPVLSRCTSLKSLVVKPFSNGRPPKGLTAKTQFNLGNLIRAAPNLQALTIRASPTPLFCYERSSALKMPSSLPPWRLDQLENLVFKHITLHADELRTLLQGLPPTIRRMDLAGVQLKNGLWVNMFELMRNNISDDCKICFHHFLVEIGPINKLVWVVGQENSEGSLMNQLLAYIEKRSALAPLRTLEAGGSAGEWEDVSDESLRYMTVVAWMAEHRYTRNRGSERPNHSDP